MDSINFDGNGCCQDRQNRNTKHFTVHKISHSWNKLNSPWAVQRFPHWQSIHAALNLTFSTLSTLLYYCCWLGLAIGTTITMHVVWLQDQNQCTKGFVHYTSLRGTWMAIWMWPSPVWSQNRHSPTTRREWTVRDTLSLSHHTWSFYPYWIADVCYWAGDLKLLWKYTSWSLHLNWSPCVEE